MRRRWSINCAFSASVQRSPLRAFISSGITPRVASSSERTRRASRRWLEAIWRHHAGNAISLNPLSATSSATAQSIPERLPATPQEKASLRPAPSPTWSADDNGSNGSANRHRMMLQPVDTPQHRIATSKSGFDRRALAAQFKSLGIDTRL